jgi:uncharacterized protein (TIGR01244 family)
MEIRQITEDYSVAPQIGVEHVPLIAGAGFKSIVCNRPDGEDPGQPSVDAIRKAAEDAGLAFRHLPVISGQMTEDNARDQAALLKELPKPVLAYCRSGTRCANLHAAIRQMGL